MEYSKIAEMLHTWGAEVRELREGVKEEISFKDTLVFWNGGMRRQGLMDSSVEFNWYKPQSPFITFKWDF